jgi:hypothetical protein
MDCTDVTQDRDQWWALVNTVLNFRIPWNAGKFLSGCTFCGFSRRFQLHEWVTDSVSWQGPNSNMGRRKHWLYGFPLMLLKTERN